MKRSEGFSLIELVAVLIIIGALSVFVFGRLNTEGFDRYAFRNELMAAARYAQKVALASGCEVELRVSSTQYALNYRTGGGDRGCGTGGFNNPVSDPSGGNFTGPSVGVTSTTTVVFGTDGARVDADPALDQTIAIDGAADIVIEGGTGYVQG